MAEIRFAVYNNLHPGYANPGRRRVLRVGGATTLQSRREHCPVHEMGPHDVQLCPPSWNWLGCMVYKVQLSSDLLKRWTKQPESYLLVASDEGAAKSYLQKRYAAIAVRQMGLAITACDNVLAKTSTRPPKAPKIGRRARKTAERETFVIENIHGNVYTLDIRDNISYAQLAIRGGKASVDLALKKAANKIAGLIQHKCKNLLFEGEVETPFPEVRRRRKAK